MDSGVYLIRNKINGRCYVGSSTSIRARIAAHKCSLNAGKHHSSSMQIDWDIMGAVAFEFLVLDTCRGRDNLCALESVMIQAYNALTDGYNTSTVTAIGGAKRSAEMVEALSLIAGGMPIRQAGRVAGVHWTSIHKAINKERDATS